MLIDEPFVLGLRMVADIDQHAARADPNPARPDRPAPLGRFAVPEDCPLLAVRHPGWEAGLQTMDDEPTLAASGYPS